MSRAAALVAVLLLAGCGSVARVGAAASPSSAASAPPSVAASPAPTASPTPAAPATRLTITGAVSGTVTGASAAGACGRTPNGDGADLRFQLNGQAYALSVELGSYHGPGTYPLPPDRVSLHTLTMGPAAQFFGSQSGTVTVTAGDASGTVDAALAGNGGDVHVTGSWSCAG